MGVAGNADLRAVEVDQRLLLGRDQELEQLHGMIDQIETRGGALVLRGDAGIGKSALLEAACDRARLRGATVVTTTGTQSEARLTFGGLHQLLLPFLDGLDQLPDPQRQALETAFGIVEGEPPDVFLVGLAALGLVTGGDAKTRLLIVVEDAHWLDRSSAEVLAFIGRRLEMEPAILLFAVRDGLPCDLDEANLPELRLDGLDDEASRALIDLSGAALSAELQERILAEADGNPLALIELPSSAGSLDITKERTVRYRKLRHFRGRDTGWSRRKRCSAPISARDTTIPSWLSHFPCGGRLNTGPLAPVEIWTTRR